MTDANAPAEEKPEKIDPIKQMIKKRLAHETGMDRLRRMYSRNEFGTISPELQQVATTGVYTFVVAGFVGGVKGMSQARIDFQRKHFADPYDSQHLARRHLVDSMSLSAAKAYWKYGVRIAPFTTLYLLSTMTVANYNNNVSLWEHGITGTVLGGLAKFNFGLKGVAAAGMLGGVLGIIGGGIIMLSMKVSGVSVEEMRYWQHEYYQGQFYKGIDDDKD